MFSKCMGSAILIRESLKDPPSLYSDYDIYTQSGRQIIVHSPGDDHISNEALVSTFVVVSLLPEILLLLKVPPLTFSAPSYCLHDHESSDWTLLLI